VIEIRRYLTDTGKDVFGEWTRTLKDRAAVSRIFTRIDRMSVGNPGDSKAVGEGVHELRIDHGPGYRVYFAMVDNVLILLGDKGWGRSQIDYAIEAGIRQKRRIILTLSELDEDIFNIAGGVVDTRVGSRDMSHATV